MITFIDGPAVGVSLPLGRAPIMLRVVRSPAGEWDALDQPSDAPKARETIHLYISVDRPTFCFLDFRDKAGRRRGVATYMGNYRQYPDPPPDYVLRDRASWAAWCDVNQERIMAERAGYRPTDPTEGSL